MVLTVSLISVNLIENLVQTVKKMNDINYIDYLGELDWKVSTC